MEAEPAVCCVFLQLHTSTREGTTSQHNSVVWTVKGKPYWVMKGRWWEKGFLTFHKKINKDGKRKKMLRPQCDVFLISDKTLTNAWSQMKTSFRLRSLNFALKPRPPSKCQYTPPPASAHIFMYINIYIIFDFFRLFGCVQVTLAVSQHSSNRSKTTSGSGERCPLQVFFFLPLLTQ